MIKKILLYFLLILSIISVSYGALTDNNEAYYTLDNTLVDATGNGNDLTNYGGATYTTSGKINGAYDFDGVDDYMDMGNSASLTLDSFTLSSWIYVNDFSSYHGIIGMGDGTHFFEWFTLTDGTLYFEKDGSTRPKSITTNTLNTNTWYHVVLVYNATSQTGDIYINGVEASYSTYQVGSGSSTIDGTTGNKYIGLRQGGTNFFDGTIDEVSIWSRALSSSEVTELYNSGSGSQYPYASTATITHNTQEFYNTENITINLSTSSNVNMSYLLDSNNETLICSDCNSTQLNLYNLSEMLHNITYIAVDSNGQTNTSTNFTIDLTPPNIQLLNLTTSRNKYLNLFEVANVTDNLSGLNICTFNITYLENVTNASDYDIFANCTDTVTLLANGLYNAYIYAEDNAGNNNTESINGTFEPYIYVYFNDTTISSLVDGYTTKVTYPNGYIDYPTIINKSIVIQPYLNSTLQLGNTIIEFSKFGYNDETFYLYLNETTTTPQIFNVTPTTLTLQVFDGNTLDQLTFNVTIINSTDSLVLENQVNLTKNYLDIPNGDIEIYISSSGYSPVTQYYTIEDDTSITIKSYLFNSNISQLYTINVQDSSNSNALESVLVEIQTLYNGTYVTLGQKLTTGSGQTYFYLDPNLIYKLILSKDSYVSLTAETIPEIYSYTIRLDKTSTSYTYIDDLSYTFLPSFSELTINQTYNFSGFISGSSFTLIEYELYYSNGTIIYQTSSTNPTGNTFTYEYNIPTTTRTKAVSPSKTTLGSMPNSSTIQSRSLP